MRKAKLIFLVQMFSLALLTLCLWTRAGVLLAVSSGGPTASTFVIPNPTSIRDINQLLDKILEFLRTIGAPIATIMIIYAGLTYIFAAGKDEKLTQARSILLWTVVGYGIILVASGILYVIQDFFGVGS